MDYQTSRYGLRLVYVALTIMLLAADLANARPNLRNNSMTGYQNSSINSNIKGINGSHHISTGSNNHFISKRELSNTTTRSGCNPITDNRAMEAPILFVKLNGEELEGLSYGTPEEQPYEVCIFQGCTEEEIRAFKRKNKRKEVTFHYNALSDAPEGKPSFKLTYTKFVTQCEAEKSSKSTPKS